MRRARPGVPYPDLLLGHLDGPHQPHRLVDGLVVLGVRVAVGHDPAPGLDVHRVAHLHQGPQGDAGVHVAGEVDVADGPAVRPPAVRLQLVNHLHRPHLGGARQGSCRQGRAEGVERRQPRPQRADDGAADVHDVTVALDGHEVGESHAAEFGHPPDVVAAEVHQHDVLGPLLGVGQQLLLQLGVECRGGPAAAGAGQRADGHLPVLHPTQDFRRRPDQGAAGGFQVEHERAGVDHPQRPVDVERVGGRLCAEPLAGHELEHVAGPDVLDPPGDHGVPRVGGEVGPVPVRGERPV